MLRSPKTLPFISARTLQCMCVRECGSLSLFLLAFPTSSLIPWTLRVFTLGPSGHRGRSADFELDDRVLLSFSGMEVIQICLCTSLTYPPTHPGPWTPCRPHDTTKLYSASRTVARSYCRPKRHEERHTHTHTRNADPDHELPLFKGLIRRIPARTLCQEAQTLNQFLNLYPRRGGLVSRVL